MIFSTSKRTLRDTILTLQGQVDIADRAVVFLTRRNNDLVVERVAAEERAQAYNKELVELLSALHGMRNTILQSWSWEAMKNALKPFDDIVAKIHRLLGEEEV